MQPSLNGDVVINRDGRHIRPKRLASNLFQVRAGTGVDRCVLDYINSLQAAPTFCGSRPKSRMSSKSPSWWTGSERSSRMPSWFTSNSPSFNWTLNFLTGAMRLRE